MPIFRAEDFYLVLLLNHLITFSSYNPFIKYFKWRFFAPESKTYIPKWAAKIGCLLIPENFIRPLKINLYLGRFST